MLRGSPPWRRPVLAGLPLPRTSRVKEQGRTERDTPVPTGSNRRRQREPAAAAAPGDGDSPVTAPVLIPGAPPAGAGPARGARGAGACQSWRDDGGRQATARASGQGQPKISAPASRRPRGRRRGARRLPGSAVLLACGARDSGEPPCSRPTRKPGPGCPCGRAMTRIVILAAERDCQWEARPSEGQRAHKLTFSVQGAGSIVPLLATRYY